MSLIPPETVGTDGAQAILTIDLRALVDNWRLVAGLSRPADCAAVIKADAYGIGQNMAAASLKAAGCRTYFVAHPKEGRRLRAVLGDDPGFTVYVLNGLPHEPGLPDYYRAHKLVPVLGSLREIAFWRQQAPDLPAVLHIDTGMNRLGLDPAGVAVVAADAAADRLGFPLALVMSHFVESEVPDNPLNARQIAAFAEVRRAFPGVPGSLANSSGIFLAQKPFHDLVRPGYALYGGNPTPGRANPMRPVVRLVAPILQLRDIDTGETAGYGARWTAKRPSRLATIGVGYADGLPRNAMGTDTKPGAEAVVAGVRCPFAGRVSMDLSILDVTDVPENQIAPGTPVELLGDTIGVDELGTKALTIGYEILTGLGSRYRRVYVGGA